MPESNKSGDANSFDVWIDRISKIVTVIAIVIGGIWFCFRGGLRAHLELTQTVSDTVVGNDRLLHVTVYLKNIGEKDLNIRQEQTAVYMDSPLGFGATVINNGGKAVSYTGPIAFRCREYTGSCNCNDSQINGTPVSCERIPGDMVLESGESDSFDWTFEVSNLVKSVKIYSYIPNDSKKDLGWHVVSFYDLSNSCLLYT